MIGLCKLVGRPLYIKEVRKMAAILRISSNIFCSETKQKGAK
jgi:hypothetical protein